MSTRNELADSLSIGILVASVQIPQLLPVTTTIKTLSKMDVTWESVTNQLVDERRILLSDDGLRDCASSFSVSAGGSQTNVCSTR